ncbi:hypothetical protein ACE103_03545 [Bradyrhizobium sp. ma5]|uniref:hypothetical protein n=1 Tax=Bradyrhizobium sp. ma5 TaxID=3344828 RepID=UPI0035D4DDEA
MATSSVISLTSGSRMTDLRVDDRSVTDIAAALQIGAMPVGAVDQMLILLENASRLNPPRIVNCADDRCEQSFPPSAKLNGGDRHHTGHRQ